MTIYDVIHNTCCEIRFNLKKGKTSQEDEDDYEGEEVVDDDDKKVNEDPRSAPQSNYVNENELSSLNVSSNADTMTNKKVE